MFTQETLREILLRIAENSELLREITSTPTTSSNSREDGKEASFSKACTSTRLKCNNLFNNFPKKDVRLKRCENNYSRNVILLKNKFTKVPYSVKQLNEWGQKGYVYEGVQFSKNWSEQEVKNKIYSLFDKKLSKFTKINLLQNRGKFLKQFFIESGCSIDSNFIFKNTKTDIFVSPEVSIIDFSKSDDEIDDIFLPKSKVLKTSHELETVTKQIDGSFTYTDESGISHQLIDVKPNYNNTKHIPSTIQKSSPKISRTNTCNENSPTNSCKDFQSIIKLCRKKITSEKFFLRTSRTNVLDTLVNYLSCPTSSLLKTISVSFTNETGVGSGLLKEIFTLAMQELKESEYLEGNDYTKTFKASVLALREKTYEHFGEICALSIIHGGPYPAFFSETFCSLLANNYDGINLDISDVLNEHVKYELERVINASTCAEVNSAMADATIFGYAGTYAQVKGPDFCTQKNVAIRDAIKFYCIDRLKEPIAAFQKGLDRDFGLFSALKDVSGSFDKLFGTSSSTLTADALLSLFVVSEEDARSQSYSFFVKYVEELESCNNEAKLKNILKFVTALDTIPALGFGVKRPKILIKPLALPTSKTCFNELYLPALVSSFDEFSIVMDLVLENSNFFDDI